MQADLELEKCTKIKQSEERDSPDVGDRESTSKGKEAGTTLGCGGSGRGNLCSPRSFE